MRRSAPQPAAAALRAIVDAASPGTPIAAVQSVWGPAVGELVAERAQPVSERAGVVTVSCRSATWAQELDLMQGQVLMRLNGALAESDPDGFRVTALRFTADAARYPG